ncbi:endo-1,4-beta-xylanase [Calidithermus terrae]|uniref:endo-1,4-beta-xylanase n=1 Tax=Calidithermus terrae TaxID=1408545 RepID=UPI001FE371FC|nr:endo-1,4-beta-xylanase [Calidithermus terrae]
MRSRANPLLRTLAAGAAVLASLALAQPAPLRALAEQRGLLIGAAVGGALYDPLEPEYAQILAREFNLVVAENAMKWASLSNERGQYGFAGADALVRFARQHGQRVRGHTLIWHEQLPAWVRNGAFSREAMLAVMQEHIQAVAGHFRGQVAYWDVVNEAVSDRGGLRETPFLRAVGPDYLEHAFRFARAADPQAKLFYNDYGADGINTKSDEIYALLKALKAKGVPIDGVGFQAHLDSTFSPRQARMRENLQRFADLGLEVHITELDVLLRGAGTREERLEAQARVYAEVLEACRAVARCTAVTLWGFTDAYSWRAAAEPLIFDALYRPKPAYHALLRALGGTP